MGATLLFYLLMYLEYLTFYYVFFHRKLHLPDAKTYCGGVLVLAGSLFGGWKNWNEDLQYAIVFPMALILIYCVYRIKIGELLKTFFLSFLFLNIAEVIVLYILMVANKESDLINHILCLIIVILMIWFYYFTVGRKLEGDISKVPKGILVLLGLAVAAIVSMIAFFIVTLLELDTQDQRMSIFICIAGVAGIFILFFIIIYYVGDLQRSKIHNLMMEQYQIEQQNYYDNMMKRETQTRQFRHDIINHLIELQEFGKRGEYDRMEAYLEHMLNDISIISRSQYDVGNTTINVMLNYYLSQKPENCNVIVDGYVSEYANVADKDLCTIVSNLLKNAIESVSHIAENMTEIRFCISRGEKYLRICVENDVQGAVLFDKNHALVTTKLDKENHGFGLMNVKCVVEKYNGRYRVLCENGKYRVDVTLEIDR